jgi:hypothetical protein
MIPITLLIGFKLTKSKWSSLRIKAIRVRIKKVAKIITLGIIIYIIEITVALADKISISIGKTIFLIFLKMMPTRISIR